MGFAHVTKSTLAALPTRSAPSSRQRLVSRRSLSARRPYGVCACDQSTLAALPTRCGPSSRQRLLSRRSLSARRPYGVCACDQSTLAALPTSSAPSSRQRLVSRRSLSARRPYGVCACGQSTLAALPTSSAPSSRLVSRRSLSACRPSGLCMLELAGCGCQIQHGRLALLLSSMNPWAQHCLLHQVEDTCVQSTNQSGARVTGGGMMRQARGTRCQERMHAAP